MARGKKAVSNVISTVLLIIIAIALAVAVYLMAGKFMHTGTTLTAAAQLVQSSYTSSGQYLLISIQVTSQARAPLRLAKVIALAVTSSGSVLKVVLTPGAAANSSGVSASLILANSSQLSVAPGFTQSYDVSLTSSTTVVSVSFELVFETPWNSTVTVVTNSVHMPS